MPSKRIASNQTQGVYFLTFTIHRWYYLFDRHQRWDILADAIRYAQQNKALKLYAYVFMLNHIHLIVESADTIDFIAGFKRHTSKEIRASIERLEPNILPIFLDKTGTYHFWQPTNAPKKIESEAFFRQKIDYIHFNPVRKQYVAKPEYWHWSSANPWSVLATDGLPL